MALTDLDSIAKRFTLMEAGGMWSRSGYVLASSTTAANTTSGLITAKRFPATVTVPSLTGYTGYELNAKLFSNLTGIIVAGIEYDLGSLAVSTNTFSAGTDASMPTKDTRIEGTSYSARQTGTGIPMLVVETALTATTPVLTTTYVNEDGTGSRTSSMTLPTNATINTAFCMTPHLNSGDTGMQDVTNMSRSTGSAGSLRVKGLLPFACFHSSTGSSIWRGVPFIQQPRSPILATSGESIAFYFFGANGATDIFFSVTGRPI